MSAIFKDRKKAVKKQIQAEGKRRLVQIRNLFAKFAGLA